MCGAAFCESSEGFKVFASIQAWCPWVNLVWGPVGEGCLDPSLADHGRTFISPCVFIIREEWPLPLRKTSLHRLGLCAVISQQEVCIQPTDHLFIYAQLLRLSHRGSFKVCPQILVFQFELNNPSDRIQQTVIILALMVGFFHLLRLTCLISAADYRRCDSPVPAAIYAVCSPSAPDYSVCLSVSNSSVQSKLSVLVNSDQLFLHVFLVFPCLFCSVCAWSDCLDCASL